jgi:hypothetical protein
MAGQRVRPTKAARRHFGMTLSTETRWVLGCVVTLVVACSGSSENLFEGAPEHVFSNAGAGSGTGGSAHAGAGASQDGSGGTTGGSGGTTGGSGGSGGTSGEAPSTGGDGNPPGDGGTGASGGSTGGDGALGGTSGSGVGGSSGMPGASTGGIAGTGGSELGGMGAGGSAGQPGGMGGISGTAGGVDTGGRVGRGGRGSGSGGRGGTASTGECDALLTIMNDALAQAQVCSPSDDSQCANVVSTACGCLVSVAKTESPATHAYLDALDALGDCPVDCTDVICPTPAVTGYCESSGSAHAHCVTISL